MLPVTLPDALRAHMASTKAGQDAVAVELGVSQSAVSRWTSGTSYPNRKYWTSLGRILGVTPEQIGAWQAAPTIEDRLAAVERQLELILQRLDDQER